MNIKLYRYVALLCLFVASSLNAEVLKVESIEFKAKKTNIDFGEPIILPFVSASQAKIAKKINDYIYIDNLKTLAPAKAKDGISRKITEADDDPIAGITSRHYKVLLNNGIVFSLQFNSESCVYPALAKFSKRVCSPIKVRRIRPIGPLRCLPMIISAVRATCQIIISDAD